ncbi:MAG: hydroxymethylpyrimidine transporter CytX [Deltaproteobacteria bacterium RBG_13_49_15]|nr:MAG: hydroxymethylpyrimidine transporter CytX [Deltaproteobacteria bacterium RBG_13_49_15]
MAVKQELSAANLFFLWFGAAISVAEILTGGFLADLGIIKGLWAILLGHLVGTFLLVMGGVIGYRERLPAIMSTRISFGKQGSYLISLINIMQLIGWTAIMIIEGGNAINGVAKSLWGFDHPHLAACVIGLFVGFWVFVGVHGFKTLNMVAVSLLLVLTVIMSVVVLTQPMDVSTIKSSGTFWAGFELSIIMPLSWFPLIADYTSMSRSEKGSWLAPFAGYFIGSCWMYAIGLIGAIFSGSPDPTHMMVAVRLGIIAMLIIGLSTITTTFLDVFSAAVSTLNIFPKINRRGAAVGYALAGTVFAMFFPIEAYTSFLYILGSVFAPLIAILLDDYFLLKVDLRNRKGDVAAGLSMGIGIAFYYLIKPLDIVIGPTFATILFTLALHPLLRRLYHPHIR